MARLDASLRLFNTLVRNMARKAHLTPMELLGNLKLNVGTAQEFLNALSQRNTAVKADKKTLRLRRFDKVRRDVDSLGKSEEQKEKFDRIADKLHALQIGDRLVRGDEEVYRVVYQGSEGTILAGKEGGFVVIPDGVMPLDDNGLADALADGSITVGKKAENETSAEDLDDGTDADDMTDVPFQEAAGRRVPSLAERDASLKTFDNEKIEQFVKERLEDGIAKGEYRIKKEGDKERIIAGAVKAFQMFHNKTITLSDGRVVYFFPDWRSFGHNKNDALAWAEYSMHFVTSSGNKLPAGFSERLYNERKENNLDRIEPIIRDEKVFYELDDKDPKGDAVVFIGLSNDGYRSRIITRLDDYGNVNADLTEVTTLITKTKTGEFPPHKPLSEVVEAVVRHQAAGFSPSTNDNITFSGDLSSGNFENFGNSGKDGAKFQGTPADARGAFDPVTETLHLFEFSDVSTFSHETMHFFLYRLRDLRDGGFLKGSELESDLAALEKFATDKDGKYDEEKIAKAWEKYLMTGETSNAELKGVFRAFRRWLVDLYNSFKNYFKSVPLTGEVKEIFDRE